MRLSYLSSRTPGYQTLLRIILTHSTIPVGMIKVHLTVAVEGRLTQKWFPAAINLVYTFAWNKTDIYGQKVWGLAEALGMLKYFYLNNNILLTKQYNIDCIYLNLEYLFISF